MHFLLPDFLAAFFQLQFFGSVKLLLANCSYAPVLTDFLLASLLISLGFNSSFFELFSSLSCFYLRNSFLLFFPSLEMVLAFLSEHCFTFIIFFLLFHDGLSFLTSCFDTLCNRLKFLRRTCLNTRHRSHCHTHLFGT